MNCQSLINQFLIDYHEGTLTLPKKVEFELHLTLCPPCRKYLASYQRTITLAQHSPLPDQSPPPELIDAILKITKQQP